MDKRERDRARYRVQKTQMNTRRAFNMKRQRFVLACQVKAGPCSDCGQRFPPWMLDFDHRDPSTKTSNLAVLLAKGRMTPELETELSKCDLVCALCHVFRTHR